MLTIKVIVKSPKRKYKKNVHFSFYLNWLREFLIFMFLVVFLIHSRKECYKMCP